MSEMSKEERLLCALNHEEPDRVPLFDLLDHKGIIERYAGRELTLDNASEVIPLAVGRVLDTTRVWMPRAPGRRVDERGFVYERVDWWNEWQVDTPFHTQAELAAFVRSEIERLEAWQPDVRDRSGLTEALAWKARFCDTVIPASTAEEALAAAWIPLGLDRFVYLEDECPALVERWLEALHAQTMRRLQSEAGCRAISPIAWIFDDIAFKGRLMFSPEYLRTRRVFAHLSEMCDLYHSYGLKVIFHSDGDITAIVPDLIAAGVDAIGPVDVPAGMDLAALKADFGSRLAFVGGIDLGVLAAGTAEDVRRVTRQALSDAGAGGGLILGSSSEELYDSLPMENILAMWEAARESEH